jgi:hypothetical protein
MANRRPSCMSNAETIPPRTAFSSRGEWLSAVASRTQISESTLLAISSQLSTRTEEDQKVREAIRTGLEHHESHPENTRNAAVSICISPKDAVDPRYEFKDGMHLLSTVTESMKQEAGAVATSRGLEVVTQGSDYISMGNGSASIETNTAVICQILRDVFGVSVGRIAGVVEHLPEGGTRHWYASGSSSVLKRE